MHLMFLVLLVLLVLLVAFCSCIENRTSCLLSFAAETILNILYNPRRSFATEVPRAIGLGAGSFRDVGTWGCITSRLGMLVGASARTRQMKRHPHHREGSYTVPRSS